MSRRGDDRPPSETDESADEPPEERGADSTDTERTTAEAADADRPSDDAADTGSDGDSYLSAISDAVSGDGSSDSDGEADRLSLVPLTLKQAVLAIAAVALVIRLVGLGARPMHFDEGRVAYWSLHYIDTGSFAYRPIVHGPFVQIVNARLFALFGPSDFLARLTPAVVAGLFPASAYLFREHLRDSEVVALAGFLGFNAIFVYYSRYLRSDMLLAAFVLTGFGFLVRYYDTRRIRYLYATGLFVSLALTTKENALVYLLTWVGATVLLVDHALFPPRGVRNGVERIRESRVGRLLGDAKVVCLLPFRGIDPARQRFEDPLAVRRKVALLTVHAAGASLLGFLVLVFFYADRGAGMAGLMMPPTPPSEGSTGLYQALGQPLQFPGYAVETVQSAFGSALDQWGSVSDGGDRGFLEVYFEALSEETTNIQEYAPAIGTFALIGFLYERYVTEQPRALVTFMSYCGLASLFGYALQNDPGTGYWLTSHIILPMTVPAAVGASRFYRWGREALDDPDSNADVLTFFVLFLVLSYGGVQTVNSSYIDTTSEDNGLVQFAQPEAEAREAFDAVSAISGAGNPDVVVYLGDNYSGAYSFLGRESSRYREPICFGGGWISSLPLPWYVGKADTSVACERSGQLLEQRVDESPPPMIITTPDDETVPRDRLEEEYVSRTYNFYRGAHPMTFHVHEDHVDEVGWESTG